MMTKTEDLARGMSDSGMTAEDRLASLQQLAEKIVQRVAELPDRTSPDDWPEAMLVTSDELLAIVADELDAVLRALPDKPDPDFETLKVALDEDRLSNRPLFPAGASLPPPTPYWKQAASDKPHEDVCRTPFECFGHNETCGMWQETPTSFSLDRSQLCTCGGRELGADGEALPPPTTENEHP